MNLFYKPYRGIIGDCIPFYAAGRYHIFYLHENRDPDQNWLQPNPIRKFSNGWRMLIQIKYS